MPSETSIDPAWFGVDSYNGYQRASEDRYFVEEEPEDATAALLDELLATLPPPLGEVVRLHVHTGLSYRDIALWMGWFCGDPVLPNKKRAWRAVRRGLVQLRIRIESDPELQFLNPGDA